MALSSRLFKGDARLEAARVDDHAHLTRGAQGDHVAKVQMALVAIDGLRIDRIELARQRYGRSTAAAVLAYKTRRRIINHAYQDAPDDIVGRMTVTRLDSDLRLWEAARRHQGECRCGPRVALDPAALGARGRGSLQLGFAVGASALAAVAAKPAALPQYGRALRVHLSITRRAQLEDGFPLEQQVEFARERLFLYGMSLAAEFGAGNGHRFVDVIDCAQTISEDDGEIALLRLAAAASHPGAPGVLRIIVCKRPPNEGPGQTSRGILVNGVPCLPFCMLNSQNVARDHSTLLHEMIHAAYSPPMFIHDPEKHSVFYEFAPRDPETPDRRWLKPDRAEKLSKAFFAV